MEHDSLGETQNLRGLVFRDKSGNLTLIADDGNYLNQHIITDYETCYGSLKDTEANIVHVVYIPCGAVSLLDVATITFSEDYGVKSSVAWKAIEHWIDTDPDHLIEIMYKDSNQEEDTDGDEWKRE